MSRFRYLVLLLLLALPLVTARCTSGNDDKNKALAIAAANYYKDVGTISNTYGSTEYEYYPVDIPEQDAGTNVKFEYSLELGPSTKDVYFTFTNINPSSGTWYPSLDSPAAGISQTVTADTSDDEAGLPANEGEILRDKPEISEFNRKPWDFLNRINPVNMLLNSIDIPEPVEDYDGQSQIFKIDAYTSVAATCRYVSAPTTTAFANPRTLNIWVANDQWTDGAENDKVNQDMVDALAGKFLVSGLGNDIYDWVTNIYGEEWGSFSGSSISEDASMLITYDNQITILLFDIDNDNSHTGGVVGYFWAKDNFKSSVIPYSNQRIMFYMDSVLYATLKKDEGSWDISDYWPSTVISILGHEFQHMIHFYQKTVMRSGGNGSETWLDEMCSLATEDLVANKAQVKGPRGVDYDNPASGEPYNTSGRLPLYNLYNDYSLTKWYSGSSVLISYSVNYAFAAYLARNYGGAKLFQQIVLNEFTDSSAIEYALGKTGYSSLTFGQLLQKWAVSNLLTKYDDTAEDYRYNDGILAFTTFTSTIDSITYTLGSIDLNNYTYGSQDGPKIHDTMKSGLMPRASNYYYRAGTGLSGTQTWNIKLKSNVRMNVVVM